MAIGGIIVIIVALVIWYKIENIGQKPTTGVGLDDGGLKGLLGKLMMKLYGP